MSGSAFGTVVRQPDVAGREVWTHSSPDRAFNFTLVTLSAIRDQRYERLLLRDGQPRNQSWDGRWIYELQPAGGGTRMTITEHGCLTFASWNRIGEWLRRVDGLRWVA